METIDRPSLEKLQLKLLKQTVASALNTPFYKKRLSKTGIRSADDIVSLDDLKKIPFTGKDDLRESYPTGLLAVDRSQVVRLHASSGTTGTPTVIYHTRDDIESWADMVARCIVAAGATEQDVFQNMISYGLFTGGLGLHYGAEKVGMLVIPSGSGNTARQLQLMQDFHSTVVHATPSYMLHVYSKLDEFKVKRSNLSLKKAFLGAEPYSENTRKRIEEMFSIDVYNSYGMSELSGPGVAFECVHKQGMHVWEDCYILEVIDPESGEARKEGEEGELVFTPLRRQATPLLRYRSRDLASIIPGSCACGRTVRRISRITGRSDDMLIVNGVNVFPSQIEEVLMKIPEVGTNYQIYLDKKGALDRMVVRVEIYSKLFAGSVSALDKLKSTIKEKIKASIVLNPVIELHEPGSLPVFELKSKRVVDDRAKL